MKNKRDIMQERITNLMKCLPISGIEPQWAGFIDGLGDDSITLFEPPAGQQEPFCDGQKLIATILKRGGIDESSANAKAKEIIANHRAELTIFERPILYNDSIYDLAKIPEHYPLSRVIDWLSHEKSVAPEIITFLQYVLEVTRQKRMFLWGAFGVKPLRLTELPDAPPPTDMIEFFVGMPDDLVWEHSPDGNTASYENLDEWKAQFKPVVEKIEKELGQKVYYFKDPTCDYDDDNCHRFCALHCWCSLLPDSSFVRYLLEVTELDDVEALKELLITPENYRFFPFEMFDAFFGIETGPYCRFDYAPQSENNRIGVVFHTQEACLKAKEIMLEQYGAEFHLWYPKGLVDDVWLREASKYGYIWSTHHEPETVAFLAGIDELFIVANIERPPKHVHTGRDVPLAVEKTIVKAHQFGIEYHYHTPSGSGELHHGGACLATLQVQGLVDDEDREIRKQFKCQKILRVDAEYGSSGIWSENGKNISYDLLDLPFWIIRRIAKWQREYDDTTIPILPDTPDDDWWKAHGAEKVKIAKALQIFLKGTMTIQVMDDNGWVNINDLS